MSWKAAERTCNNMAPSAGPTAHLTSVVSQSEMEFIMYQTRLQNIAQFWIGLNDNEVHESRSDMTGPEKP